MFRTTARLIASLLFLAAALPSGAATYVSAAAGAWSSSSTWSPPGVPGPGDTVTVSHAITLDVSTSVATATLNGGSIGGSAQTLSVTSSFTWNGGTLGPGGGTLQIPPAASLTIASGSPKDLRTFTIDNDSATSVWAAGSGTVTSGQGAVFRNDGTFTIHNDAAFYYDNNGTPTVFENNGTLRKQTASGTSMIGTGGPFPFENKGGTIDVQSGTIQVVGAFNVSTAPGSLITGTLELPGGGTQSANFSLGSGASVVFSGATHTLSAALSGVAGSTVSVTTGSVLVNGTLGAATINLVGGTLSGTGTITPSSSFAWSGGFLGTFATGGGTLQIPNTASLTISGGASKDLRNFTIDNDSATSVWAADSGTVTSGHGAFFRNDGTFTIRNDAAFYYDNNGTITVFENNGTLRKEIASGTSIIGTGAPFPFENKGGTIDVQSGTIQVMGPFNVTTAPGTLSAGTLQLSGGGTQSANFSLGSGASVVFSGATHTLSAALSGAGGSTVSVTTGSVLVNGTLGAATINLSGGTLSGTGTITPASSFAWSGGFLGTFATGGGTLQIPATASLTISGGAAKDLRNFTIDNDSATSVWAADSGTVTSGHGAIFRNDGTFTIRNDAAFYYDNNGTITVFENTGTLRKEIATGTTVIGTGGPFPFENKGGTIDVQSGTIQVMGSFNVTTAPGTLSAGTLQLSGGGTQSANFSLGSSATVLFAGGTHTLSAAFSGATGSIVSASTGSVLVNGTLGAATINLAGGTLSGTGTITPSSSFAWSGGFLGTFATGGGTLQIPATASLTISGGAPKDLRNFTIDNDSATSVWAADSGTVTSGHGAVFRNDGTFTIRNDAAFYYDNNGTVTVFENNGTLRKEIATGTSIIGTGAPFPVDSTGGTIDVASGTLSIVAALTLDAAAHLKFGIGGTTAGSQFGVLALSSPVDLAGSTLTAYPVSGFVPAPADTFQVLTTPSRTGTFGAVNTAFSGGVVLQPAYNSTNVTLLYGNAGTLDLSASSYPVAENAGTVLLAITRTGGDDGAVSVSWSTADLTATAGNDYTPTTSGTVNLADGQSSATITVPILDDTTDEPAESFTVSISSPTGNAALGTTTSASVDISDDDAPPVVQFDSASQSSPGESGTMNVTVSLSQPSAFNVTVPFSLDGSSTAGGGDFTIPTSSPLTILAGGVSATIAVDITADATDEAGETVVLTLGAPVNATLGSTTTHTATITDDDAPPTVQFSSASQSSATESGTMTVTVDLSAASSNVVTVPFSIDGSSTADGSDYSITPSPITIPAGSTSGSATITITGDGADETDETVVLTLGAPANATLGATTTHTATITDDEGTPSVQFTTAAQSSAGEAGTLTLTVALSAPSAQIVTVPFTVDGSSTASASDYSLTASPITIAPGNLTGSATLTITPDTTDEPDETVVVTLGAPTNATLGTTTTHTATITDDEGVPSAQFTTAAQSSAGESGTLTLTVALSAPSAQTVTVPFTVDGSSTASASDYSLTASPITIAPGNLTGSATLTITPDATDEPDETVVVTLGAPTNAVLGATTTHTATITDDDATPTAQFATAAQSSAAESGSMTVTVTLSGPSSQTVTVPFAIAGSSTASASDYSITPSPITIAAGAVSGDATITITPDSTDEPNETVVLTLGAPTNATLGATTTHTATITDDDSQPAVTVNDPAASEGSSGSTAMDFLVTLSASSAQTITVNYATADGTATAGSDYNATLGTATFLPGVTTATVTVTVNGDTSVESSETVALNLLSATNATIADSQGLGTIINDDSPVTPTISIADANVTEGDAGITPLAFTVALSTPSPTPVTVDYATVAGTATLGTDFVAATGTLTFAAGQTSATINAGVIGDTADESDETLTVVLSNPTGATIAAGTATGTIVDDDDSSTDQPELTVLDIKQVEGDSGPTPFVFTVELSQAAAETVRVEYATAPETADAITDFTPGAGTLVFEPGGVLKSVTVTVQGDTRFEADERFRLTLANAAGATIRYGSATGVITNDDEPVFADLSTSIELLDSAEPQRYRVTVRNDGPDDTAGVRLAYTVPHVVDGTSSVTLSAIDHPDTDQQAWDLAAVVGVVPTQGTCEVREPADPTTGRGLTMVLCDLATLGSGESAFVDVQLLMHPAANPTVAPQTGTMIAHVAADANDLDVADNRATLDVPIVFGKPQFVVVEHAPQSPAPGGRVNLTARVYNRSGSVVPDAELVIEVSNLHVIAAVIDGQPCAVRTTIPQKAATIRCAAALDERSFIEASLVAQLTDETAVVDAELIGVGGATDIVTRHEIRSAGAQEADLVATLEQGTTDGDASIYRVTVRNNGPKAADHVIVVYEVPHVRDLEIGARLMSWDTGVLADATASRGTCVVRSGVAGDRYAPATAVCEIGALASGDTATVDLRVFLADSTRSASTTATVAGDAFDPNTANNRASLTAGPHAGSYSIQVDHEPENPAPGGLVRLRIRGAASVIGETSENARLVLDIVKGLEILAASVGGRPCEIGNGPTFSSAATSHVHCEAALPHPGFLEAHVVAQMTGELARVDAYLDDPQVPGPFAAQTAHEILPDSAGTGVKADLSATIEQRESGGEVASYRITVRNDGPHDAANVFLNYEVPHFRHFLYGLREGAILVNAEARQGSCEIRESEVIREGTILELDAPTSVRCDLGPLASGGTTALDVDLMMIPSQLTVPDGGVVMSAAVVAEAWDPDTSNNRSEKAVALPSTPEDVRRFVTLEHAPVPPPAGGLVTIVARGLAYGPSASPSSPDAFLVVEYERGLKVISATIGDRTCALRDGSFEDPGESGVQHALCSGALDVPGFLEARLTAQMTAEKAQVIASLYDPLDLQRTAERPYSASAQLLITTSVQTTRALPEITVDDSSAPEGGRLPFTVRLSEPSTDSVTVDYTTVAGTATQGTDYSGIPQPKRLFFAPGETSRQVTVTLSDDLLVESHESFTFRLENPANATLRRSSATGTILNDDVEDRFADLSTNITLQSGPESRDVQRYRVTVANDGPSAAEDVLLTYTAPALSGTQTAVVMESVPSQGSCDVQRGAGGQSGAVVVCRLGRLGYRESATLDVALFVDVRAGLMTAVVAAATPDLDPDDNRASSPTMLTSSSLDVVFVEHMPENPAPGALIRITARLLARRTTSPDAKLVIGVPPQISIVNASGGGAVCPRGTGLPWDSRANWQHFVCPAEVGVGGFVEAIVLAHAPAPAFPVEAWLIDPQRQSADQYYLATGNDLIEPGSTPAKQSDLSARIKLLTDVNSDPAFPLVYSISVTNNGPQDAAGTRLVYELPHLQAQSDQAILVGAKPSGGTCQVLASASIHTTWRPGDQPGGLAGDYFGPSTLVCDFGTIASGAGAAVDVTLLAHEEARGSMTATVASANSDVDLTNNRVTQEFLGPRDVDPLLVTLDHSPARLTTGGLVRFTVRGFARAFGSANAKLSLILPKELTIVSASMGETACPALAGDPGHGLLTTHQHVLCSAPLSSTGMIQADVNLLIPSSPFLATAVLDAGEPGGTASIAQTIVPSNLGSERADLVTVLDVPTPEADAQQIRVHVTNKGPGPATGAHLVFRVPQVNGFDQAILASATPSTGSCRTVRSADRRGTTVQCELGTLPPNESATLDVAMVLLADARGAMTAMAVADTPDDRLSNNEATAEVRPATSVESFVTLSHNPATPPLGGLVTITARGFARANAESPDAKLVVTLSSSLAVLSASVEGRACVLLPGSAVNPRDGRFQTVECTAPLRAFDFVEALIVAQVTAPQEYSEVWLVGTREMTLAHLYAARAIDPIFTTSAAVSSTDLAVEKQGPLDLTRGSTVDYTITVRNAGSAPAAHVTVIDPVPAGLALVSVGGACTQLPCSIAALAPGQTATITTRFSVLDSAAGTITNVATVQASGNTDPTPANDTSSVASRVTCTRPAAPILTAPASAASGQPYTISWKRSGAAASYELQESTTSDFTNAQTTTLSATAPLPSFTHDVARDTRYLYRVRTVACDGSRSDWSPVAAVAVLAPPPPPAANTSPSTVVVPRGTKTPTSTSIVIGGTGITTNFTATTDREWMTVSPSAGVLPPEGTKLNVTMDPAKLPVGASFGTVNVALTPLPGARIASHDSSTLSIPVSVSVVSPVTTSPRSFPPPPGTVIIPAVAHADGPGSQWRSDVRVANVSWRRATYLLTFTPSQSDVAVEVQQASVEVEPGRVLALEDVVRTWFGTNGSGTLEIRPAEPGTRVIASSRTYNATPAGTVGQFVPAVAISRLAGFGASPLHLQQIAQTSGYRTNIGLVEGTGSGAETMVRFLDSMGATLLNVPVSLRGGEHRQLDAILRTHGITATDARVEVSVLGGDGQVTSYASVVDERSGDAQLIPPSQPSIATRIVLPGVGNLTTPTSRWRSDVRLFNSGPSAATATLHYFPAGASTPAKTLDVSIEPGATSVLDDVVAKLGLNGTSGVLQVSSSTLASLVASARTYDDRPTGTLGQFIAGLTSADATAAGEPALQILQAEESASYRTNLGLTEVSGQPVRVEISAIVPEWAVTPVVELELAPNQYLQLGSVLRSMNPDPAYNARIAVRVVGGKGRVAAFASSVDNRTQDPTYIPAQ